MKIKCNKKECMHHAPRKKIGCKRESDPYSCKGYLLTIIDVQQTVIEDQGIFIEKAKQLLDAVEEDGRGFVNESEWHALRDDLNN